MAGADGKLRRWRYRCYCFVLKLVKAGGTIQGYSRGAVAGDGLSDFHDGIQLGEGLDLPAPLRRIAQQRQQSLG